MLTGYSITPPAKLVLDQKQHRIVIVILASLSAIGPFSVDMYLPVFPAIAAGLRTDIAHVGLSLTSYFIGMAIGQIAYGPVMDRHGRKKPLIIGLLVYIAAALGCAFSPSINFLISLRLFLALGGCVGLVGSRAVVRDLFSGSEIARVLSLLMMVFGIAPIVAPTIGGLVVASLGWRSIFLILAAIAVLVVIAVSWRLPESKGKDTSFSLRPTNIVLEYRTVLREPVFVRYALTTAAASAGFFSYISGSPFVYMKLLGFSETEFGWIYGANVLGLIIASQINRLWLRRRTTVDVLRIVTAAQLCGIIALLTGNVFGLFGTMATVGFIFFHVSCYGLITPNVVALALQPFTRNAGSASALIGSMQMVAAASASGSVSYLHNGTAMPMLSMMAACTTICLMLQRGSALVTRRAPGHVADDILKSAPGAKNDVEVSDNDN